tara:strand:+ start:482 stop:658 length:177 start_codon:yes stop_codon:yes gene_type:complete
MSISMFVIGFGIFVVYMFLLVRMINTQHKIQERELQQNKVVKRKIKSKNKKVKHGVKL